MANGQRPTKRIYAKHKDNGTYLNLFVCWPSQIPGSMNLTIDGDGEDFEKFAKNPKKYFINLVENKPKDGAGGGKRKPDPNDDDEPAASEDDPFEDD